MKIKIYSLIAVALIFYQCKQSSVTKIKDEKFIEIYDSSLGDFIDTTALVEVLGEGFVWSEGPLWLEEEEKLLFTDVPENKIYAWSQKEGVQLWLTPSGYTQKYDDGGKEGANGLALDANNRLVLCQHGDRAIVRFSGATSSPTPSFEVLTDKYMDKRYNSPNDLHIDVQGNIFFTDPPYGLPKYDEDPSKEFNFNGIFCRLSDGQIILVDTTMTRPNGIALSKDNKYLYVSNSDPKQANWVRFTLDSALNVVNRELFADKTDLLATLKGLPDGLKIHPSGLIFATGPGGVLIFHPDGRHMGTVLTGKATANCAFDKDAQYLYMTAHDQLMRVKLK